MRVRRVYGPRARRIFRSHDVFGVGLQRLDLVVFEVRWRGFFFTTLPLVFRWLVSPVTLSTFVNSFIRLCLLGCG